MDLNYILNNREKKQDFGPYATRLLKYVMGSIKDINFKICLTSINIVNKLLVSDVVDLAKVQEDLIASLIEKLSDSKVIIRQAVLKCCGNIVRYQKPLILANQAKNYLQHTNWHVREGIAHILANCII